MVWVADERGFRPAVVVEQWADEVLLRDSSTTARLDTTQAHPVPEFVDFVEAADGTALPGFVQGLLVEHQVRERGRFRFREMRLDAGARAFLHARPVAADTDCAAIVLTGDPDDEATVAATEAALLSY